MQFEEFAAARLPAPLRYAFVLCGDRELARDLVQEVLAGAPVRWRMVQGLRLRDCRDLRTRGAPTG